jgi:hypothetical protein
MKTIKQDHDNSRNPGLLVRHGKIEPWNVFMFHPVLGNVEEEDDDYLSLLLR